MLAQEKYLQLKNRHDFFLNPQHNNIFSLSWIKQFNGPITNINDMLLSTCDHFEKRQEGRNIRDNASGDANNQIQSKEAEQKKSQDNSRCLDSNQIDTEVNKMDNTVNTYQDTNENRPQQQNSIHGHLLQCYSTTCRKETNSSCYSTECRNKQNNELIYCRHFCAVLYLVSCYKS